MKFSNSKSNCKSFVKLLHINTWIDKVKLLTVFIFVLVLKVTSPNVAYAFLSSVDTCAAQPACAAAIGAEIAPAVAAPTTQATAISITTVTGATTTVESVGGIAVVAGDMRLSGVVAAYIWNQAQNQQAQDLAQRKYCAANPNDSVCVPFTGGQSPGVMYWAVTTGVSIWNCPMLQNSYGFQFEYCDDSSGYGSFYDLSHRVGGGITNLRGPVQFLGFRQALDQFNQGCWFMDVLTADGYRSERQVCNYGPWFPPPGKMKFAGLLRMDGQPDTGGNPPPLPWKDWP